MAVWEGGQEWKIKYDQHWSQLPTYSYNTHQSDYEKIPQRNTDADNGEHGQGRQCSLSQHHTTSARHITCGMASASPLPMSSASIPKTHVVLRYLQHIHLSVSHLPCRLSAAPDNYFQTVSCTVWKTTGAGASSSESTQNKQG